jgi:predicted AlkP superfamily phosphohydrolase/phosphomutase
MTEQRFDIAHHLATTRDWDFLMMVDMGMDRFHHAFWHTWNTDHPSHDPGGPMRNLAARYYARIDARVGELVDAAGDGTAVVVVSDHGARTLAGGICINEILLDAGLLRLERRPRAPTRLEDCDVDWDRTIAWAEGGYYGRVFLNLLGREPRGCLLPAERERVRDELAALLRSVRGLGGAPLRTRVVRPEEAFGCCTGLPPDLMVFFDDLGYRAVGTVGHGRYQTEVNDTGPDGCNHDWNGLFAIDPAGRPVPPIGGIQDVGSALLDLLEVPRLGRPTALGGIA